MEAKTGKYALITYHTAYNYGSVLQAYATQQALREIGADAQIINYRMAEQRYFYEKLLRPKYGIKTLLCDMTFLPVFKKKKRRNESFEAFFRDYLSLTRECSEPEEVSALWSGYDAIISGSDQIWNKSSCELRNNDWRYMEPYLLKGYGGKKVSYASSINTMDGEDLQRILPEINLFQALSFREEASGRKISQRLNREVSCVLDPTFLLTKEKWVEKLALRKIESRKPYIFCYSLTGARSAARLIRSVKRLAKLRKCGAVIVTPFAYVPMFGSDIEIHPEYGPREFLEALYNAEAVITDSYHGTVLSVNFEKEFYSLTRRGRTDVRKSDILGKLGLLDRIANDADEISNSAFPPIDYEAVNKKLGSLRRQSMDYLKRNLQ